MMSASKLAIAGGLAVATVAAVIGVQSIAAQPAASTSGQLAPGLIVPTMNPERGMHLFASKGCVVCHSINGVGGTDAPKLDATTMAPMMNPFEFFAKMWRGATPMIAMQQHELGHQIEFTGQDLADIVAFVHNRQVQKTFTAADIPPDIKKHMEGDDNDRGGGMGGGMMGGPPHR
jgi:cytochrome c